MKNTNNTVAKALYNAAGKHRNIVYAWGEGNRIYVRLRDHRKMNLWNVVMLPEVKLVQLLPGEIYRIELNKNALNFAAELTNLAA